MACEAGCDCERGCAFASRSRMDPASFHARHHASRVPLPSLDCQGTPARLTGRREKIGKKNGNRKQGIKHEGRSKGCSSTLILSSQNASLYHRFLPHTLLSFAERQLLTQESERTATVSSRRPSLSLTFTLSLSLRSANSCADSLVFSLFLLAIRLSLP